MAPDEDPFADVDVSALLGANNLKWRRHADDVLPAWIADMDVGLCPEIADSMIGTIRRATSAGSIGYPADELAASVAEAFCARSRRLHGWSPEAGRVRLITDIVGGLTALVDQVTDPGDGVVLQTPVYPPFLEQIEAMGRRVVHHRGDAADGTWSWDPDELDRQIDDRAKVLVVVNPHNPTGRVLRRDELVALAEVAERHDLVVVSDEVHAELVLDEAAHVPFASLDAATAARTVTLTSAGKAFNLAGLRCAIAHFGSEELLSISTRRPHTFAGQVSSPAMWAVLAAWESGDDWREGVLRSLVARRETVRSFLADHLPDIVYLPGEATFLAWLDCTALGLGDEPADFFLSQARVALAPGTPYGPQGAGFARLNFATSESILSEILERMVTAIDIRRAAS